MSVNVSKHVIHCHTIHGARGHWHSTKMLNAFEPVHHPVAYGVPGTMTLQKKKGADFDS